MPAAENPILEERIQTSSMGRAPAASAECDALGPVIRVSPSGRRTAVDLAELWNHRGLIYFLVWRDLKVRYRQTALGALWAILQPAFTMAIFSVIFGRLAKLPSDGVPYPVFALAALLPWTFFSNGFAKATGTLVNQAAMIKKTYFPRVILPLATILAGAVDYLAALPFLIGLMLFYRFVPGWQALWIVAFLLIALVAAIGMGLWFSALNVEYRDAGYVVPFLVQIWLFATPIAYPTSLVPQRWRLLYAVNPMVAVVDGTRWALLRTSAPSLDLLAISTASALLMMLSGALYFRRVERNFADIV